MFVKTIAIAAALAAPAFVKADADAPLSVADPFAACEEKLGTGGSHSLLDIVGGQFEQVNNGEATVLLSLIEEVSDETLEILDEFDVTGEGYTLLVPFNTITPDGDLLAEVFDLNSTAVLAAADDIISAHIIPGTILFADVEDATAATGEYVLESINGFEWTFGWEENEGGGGFPFIVDMWNVTETGEIQIQMDITNEPDCPNRVVAINGFVVTPDDLPETPAPVAAPPPEEEEAEDPVEVEEPEEEEAAPEEDASGAGSHTPSLIAASAAGAAALAAVLL